ncbi:hypothetical protein H4219_001226 [Mycoemilia scoparia]|uniref:Uncharacterized protein n=1 Tax=Mycoemilia scoparia TaxID=417184 RepID=A0A9W8A1G6_9FUNG|nr:hypothetical protein H4219_001226 [Mycoemilia scoparia]
MDNIKERKVAVLGHRGVGKSSLVFQYIENAFVSNYYPTIENIVEKQVEFRGSKYNIAIYDTAGQDEFSQLNSRYTVGVQAFIVVYSVNSRESYEMAITIHDKLVDQTGNQHVNMVLVGNKTDLADSRVVSYDEAKGLAQEFGCPYIESSAKNKVNIEEIFVRAAFREEIEAEVAEAKKKEDAQKKNGGVCTIM